MLWQSNRWEMKNNLCDTARVLCFGHDQYSSEIITKLLEDMQRSMCTSINTNWCNAGRQYKTSVPPFTVWTDVASFSIKGVRFSAAFSPSWKKLRSGREQMLSHDSTSIQTNLTPTTITITCKGCILSNCLPAQNPRYKMGTWLTTLITACKRKFKTKTSTTTQDLSLEHWGGNQNHVACKGKVHFSSSCYFRTQDKKRRRLRLTWVGPGSILWSSGEDRGPDAPWAPGSSKDTENKRMQTVRSGWEASAKAQVLNMKVRHQIKPHINERSQKKRENVVFSAGVLHL